MNVPPDPLMYSRVFHFFQGEAQVVKQPLVGLKQGAVFVHYNNMLRKEIHHLPEFALVLLKFRFRLSNFFKGASQCFLRALSLNGYYGDVTRAFDQSQISFARGADFGIVHSEGAEKAKAINRGPLSGKDPFHVPAKRPYKGGDNGHKQHVLNCAV
jgi:hypothetical protein